MIRVVNRNIPQHDGALRFNIMRPTALGNPFVIGRDGDRAEVISKFENWIMRAATVGAAEARAAIRRIIELDQKGAYIELACCCKPQACHGDIIMQIVISQRAKELTNA
jgi:hypothetical protein